MTINEGMMSSDKDDWETPDDMFDNLNNEFHFDVDVCDYIGIPTGKEQTNLIE